MKSLNLKLKLGGMFHESELVDKDTGERIDNVADVKVRYQGKGIRIVELHMMDVEIEAAPCTRLHPPFKDDKK